MILVTGATGHLGKATIHHLLKKGVAASDIAGLVRDETKAAGLKDLGITLRNGSYDDYNSLVAAFQGVDKLLLVSSNDLENRLRQHLDVLRAAKEAGIKHIVYTSFTRKNETETNPLGTLATSHIDTDKAIKASGIPFTIMLNGLYAETLPMFIGEHATETGVYYPAGEGKTAFTLRDDMAEAAAVILTTAGHENKDYEITSDVNLSFQQVADMLTSITGKTVGYFSPSPDEFAATLAKAGVPEMYIWLSQVFAEAVKQGEFESTHTDLEHLIGRKATSLEVFLRAAYGK